jgi:hypothetical protein
VAGSIVISADGSIGNNSVGHEDGGIEPKVEGTVGEEGVMPSLDDVSDGNVEKDDVGIGARDLCSKFGFDEHPVDAEFFSTVGKSESGSSGSKVPGGRPLSSHANPPFCISDS